MAGCASRANNPAAIHAAIGVFPVPPTVRLPTLTAGIGVSWDGSQPASYKMSLAPTIPPNTRSAGARIVRAADASRSSAYQIRSASALVQSVIRALFRQSHGRLQRVDVVRRLARIVRLDAHHVAIRTPNFRKRQRN